MSTRTDFDLPDCHIGESQRNGNLRVRHRYSFLIRRFTSDSLPPLVALPTPTPKERFFR